MHLVFETDAGSLDMMRRKYNLLRLHWRHSCLCDAIVGKCLVCASSAV